MGKYPKTGESHCDPSLPHWKEGARPLKLMLCAGTVVGTSLAHSLSDAECVVCPRDTEISRVWHLGPTTAQGGFTVVTSQKRRKGSKR